MFKKVFTLLFLLLLLSFTAATSATFAESNHEPDHETENADQDEESVEVMGLVPGYVRENGFEHLASLHPIPADVFNPPRSLLSGLHLPVGVKFVNSVQRRGHLRTLHGFLN